MITYFSNKIKFFVQKGRILMKKTVFVGICLGIGVCAFGAGLGLSQLNKEEKAPYRAPTYVSRPIPADADFGSYLAGLIAQNNLDITKASDYYAKAYAKDKNNTKLKRDLYLISGLAGRQSVFEKILEDITPSENMYHSGLFLAAKAVKEGDYEGALKKIPTRMTGHIEQVIYPLIRAWSYVGMNKDKAAYLALLDLKKIQNTDEIYWTHRALIGIYLKQPQVVQEAFKKLVKKTIPTETILLAAKYFYEARQEWYPTNPMYEVYHEQLVQKPQQREILVERANEFSLKSPAYGLAEGFFFISSVVREQQDSLESGLLFNTMALYLNPDSSYYKIWGIEQFEGAGYYAEANRLLDTLQKQSDTTLFKKALNLILMEKEAEAEKILTDIQTRLPNDKLLMMILADLYKSTNRFERSMQTYTHLLDILKQSQNTAPEEFAKVYFSRAMVYNEMNDFEAMKQDLILALSFKSEDVRVLTYLGYALIEEGAQPEMGLAYIQQAHALEPKEAYIWDALAWGYYVTKQYDKALKYAERAVEEMPYSAIAQSHLGDIYAKLGRLREASFQYNKALRSKEDMTDRLRQELQEKLKL